MTGKPLAPREALADSLLVRLSLAVLVAAAVGSFATALRTWPAWLLLLPVVISVFWRPGWLPMAVVQAARRLGWLFSAAAVVMGWVMVVYPILTTQQVNHWSLVIGYLLAFLACLFLLGSSLWNPTWTLFPTTFGTLLVSAFQQDAPIQAFLMTAGGAVIAFLWLQGTPPLASAQRRSRIQPLRPLSIAITVAGVFSFASSMMVFLPWSQQKVENLFAEWYIARTAGETGLTPHSLLGELGELKLSKRVVLRVWTSQPQRLRGYVLTEFDGREWSASAPPPVALFPESQARPLDDASQAWLEELPGEVFEIPREHPKEPRNASSVIRTKILRSAASDDLLLAPSGASWVRASLPEVRLGYGGALLEPPAFSASIYGVLQPGGQKPSPPLPSEDRVRNLATPEDTDPRLRELAKLLAMSSSSAEELVQNTVDRVSSCCQYSLDIGNIRSSQPVAEFLFEKRRGWCEYFATAAALLLRLQGIPTRYVTGFNVIESNRVGGHYVIRDLDAHAWIEAYVPGKGWIEADPTPAVEYEALHADLNGGGGDHHLLERTRADVAMAWAVFWDADWRRRVSTLSESLVQAARYFFIEHAVFATLIAVVLTVTLLGTIVPLRTHQPAGILEEGDAGSLPPELIVWMDRLDELWAKHGLSRPSSKAPLEHLSMLPADRIDAELRRASGDLIECFYRARFRREAVSAEEVKRLASSMEQALQRGSETGRSAEN